MLSLMLAAAVSAATPAVGTYTYVTSLNGAQIEKTNVTVSRDQAGNIVLSEKGSGFLNGQSGSVTDTLTLDQALAPLNYSAVASIADSRHMESTLNFTNEQALQSGDVSKTYSLAPDAKHFVVLDFGPVTGYFAFPAQMQAWNDTPVMAIVPLYAQGVPIAVDKSLKPDRPQGVPARDVAVSVNAPVQFTVWYDPKTLVADEMEAPAEGLVITRLP